MAFLAKASTCLFREPKVTSTTFWTSARSEPRSMHDFPKAAIAPILSTDAITSPAFFQAFATLEVCCSTCFVAAAVCFFTFSISSRYGCVYASMTTRNFSNVMPSVSHHRLSFYGYASVQNPASAPGIQPPAWPVPVYIPLFLLRIVGGKSPITP